MADEKTLAEDIGQLSTQIEETSKALKEASEKRDAQIRELGQAKSDQAEKVEELYDKLKAEEDERKALEAKHAELTGELEKLSTRADEIERNNGRPGNNGQGGQTKTIGQQFAESEQVKRMQEEGARTMSDPVRFESGLFAPSRLKTLLDTGQISPQAIREPMLPAVERTLRMRDVMSVTPVSVPSGEYYEETGFNAGSTAAVTSITRSGQVATLTTTEDHGFGDVGAQVIITVAGADQTEYNGRFLAKITSATVLTYTVSGSPITATGTVTVYKNQTHGAAAMTTEGSNLPEARLQFTLQTWQAKKVGHYLPITREVREDNAQLAAYIDNRLLYGLEYAVETGQILYGDGTGANLPGILNNAFIQKYAWSEGLASPVDTRIDAIRRAMTRSLVSDYMPNGLVINPFDWEAIELAKGTDNHYLTLVGIDNAGITRFFRIPVVVTASIAAGTALIGSFGRAAELKDYRGAEIRVTDSHGTDFIADKEVIKATERIGLAVYRPESFVEVTFDAAPTA